MKKIYIMLFIGIHRMGGGQMYINNKLSFVSELGWEPRVFFATRGNIVIPGLKKYEDNIIEEMMVSPLVHSKNTVTKVIQRLTEEIGDCDEVVIESGCACMALWGELLAAHFNCKHMVHLLAERPDAAVPKEYLDFYKFKHERRELSGINIHSLKILFRDFCEINDDNSYHLSSVCSNVVCDTNEDPLNIPLEGISLGCIGRLEKPYVEVASKAFAEIALKHPGKKFNILIIGDSEKQSDKDKIDTLFVNIPNVNLIMPGAVYPISVATLKKISLFVSASGSANATYRSNIPTIALDMNDLMPIGVLGYTAKGSLCRTDEESEDLVLLIEKILFKNYLENLPYVPPKPISLEPLKEHIKFLNESSNTKEYFDIYKMKAAGSDKKKRLLRMMFGMTGYKKIHDIWINKVKNALWKKGDNNAK